MEFNVCIRSLPCMLKKNKHIGLVIVDGLHYIENSDYMSNLERKQAKAQTQKV